MSEQHLNKEPQPVVVINPAQGMHCELKGEGTVKCTVSMNMVCLTTYHIVDLLKISDRSVSNRFNTISRYFPSPVKKEDFCQDFGDLVKAVSKVQSTRMSLPSGDKVITYCIGEPQKDEQGFLYLSPTMKEWWEHPNIEPIVTAIQVYLPDFKPWLLHKDEILCILSQKSTLL